MTSGAPYVFLVGFNKTGTRSYQHFFASNNISCVHHDNGKLALAMLNNMFAGRKILAGYDQRFRAYSDMTYLNHNIELNAQIYFRILDRDYPGSYFIYNTRPMEDWLASRERHGQGSRRTVGDPANGQTIDNSFLARCMAVYNTNDPQVVRAHWRTARIRLEEDLMAYFGKSDRFATIDITKDDVPARISALLKRQFDASHWHQFGKTASSK
jgi:hypothetical protein